MSYKAFSASIGESGSSPSLPALSSFFPALRSRAMSANMGKSSMRAMMRGSICCKAKMMTEGSKGGAMFRRLPMTFSLILICSVMLLEAGSEPVKIFALQRPDVSPDQVAPQLSEARDPLVYGLSWRFRWKTIEPQEGQYNWQPLDKALEITGNAGKKVILRMVAGIHTPDWVYQAGAKPFDFSNKDLARAEHYAESLRLPIPWDESYLAKWEAFIQAFGKRYNGNPHIYSVAMSGAGHIDEMN